nr:C580 [uncultured bacterium]
MSEERVVIVGAGHGGFQLAACLRQDGFAGRITMFGDEEGLPYQRPPLSKAYIKTGDATRLALRPEKFFDRNEIVLRSNSRIVAIDRSAHRAMVNDGTSCQYDHLVLATGARNVTPPIAGLDLNGVYRLRTLGDAERLRERIGCVRHVVVVGGGFIGLEFAAVAREQGIAVTVVEGGSRTMGRAVSPAISTVFHEAHLRMGSKILVGSFVERILDDGQGNVRGIRLASGTELDGDTVLIAAGVVPNTELAAAAGLTVENGIVVDGNLRTSDPNISALGDCAAFPEPQTGGRLRMESIQAATDHARTISKRLTGTIEPYTAVPWFWSDQGKLKLQIVGLVAGADDYFTVDLSEDRLAVYCFREDRLICVETINSPAEHLAARKLFASQCFPSRRDLESVSFDIHQLAIENKRRLGVLSDWGR